MATQVVRQLAGRVDAWRVRHAALAEVGLLALLYGVYSVTRSFSGEAWDRARANADAILDVERAVGLDVEAGLNRIVARNELWSVVFSVFYASAHFVVTGLLLVGLFRHRRALYARLRNTLIGATGCALVLYLLLPTAPPRLVGWPYIDMLAATAEYGWWDQHASAPKGFGGFTNELAAFPSMHAGWSLWVAIAVVVAWRSVAARVCAVGYAAVSAVDVVVTANHWTLDVLAGWLVVGVAAALCLRGVPHAAPDEAPPLVAARGQSESEGVGH